MIERLSLTISHCPLKGLGDDGFFYLSNNGQWPMDSD